MPVHAANEPTSASETGSSEAASCSWVTNLSVRAISVVSHEQKTGFDFGFCFQDNGDGQIVSQ